jgi:cell division protein FtsB
MKRGGRWLIVIAVFAVVVFLFLAGPNGLIRFIRMKRREVELERRMVQLEAEIEITRQKIQKLSSDPEFFRQVAKERLEMIDPQDSLKKDTNQTDIHVNDSLPGGE